MVKFSWVYKLNEDFYGGSILWLQWEVIYDILCMYFGPGMFEQIAFYLSGTEKCKEEVEWNVDSLDQSQPVERM